MIRAATTADFDALVALGRVMLPETELAFLSYDENKVAALLDQARLHGFLRVHERDGEIDGFFVAIITEPWFARARVATDLVLFVRPDRRGGLIAAQLIEEYIVWAQDEQLDQIIVSISTGIEPERLARLLERYGFGHLGGNFHKRIS